MERRAGRRFGLVRLPGFERLDAEVAEVEVERVDVEIDVGDLLGVGRDAAGVRQKLLQRDGRERRVHSLNLVPEDLADRGVPSQPALVHHHAGKGGRHGLGVRTEMEAVVDGHRNVRAERPNADRARGDHLAILHDRGRERRKRVTCPNRFEIGVQISVLRSRA